MKTKNMLTMIGFFMFCMVSTATAGITELNRGDFVSAFEYDFVNSAVGDITAGSGGVIITGGSVNADSFPGQPLIGIEGNYFHSSDNSITFDFFAPVSAIGMDVWSGGTYFNLDLFDASGEKLGDTIQLSASTWQQFSLGFVGFNSGLGDSISSLQISTTSGFEFVVDNIIYQQASSVPVPGSALLLMTGLVGIIGIRKKR